MNEFSIFSTSLFIDDAFLTDDELIQCNCDIDNITKRIKNLSVEEEIGGIEYDLNGYDLPLLGKLESILHKIHPNIKIDNYWLSESSKNTSVISHNHMNSHKEIVVYNAIFYLQSDFSGDLFLENPDALSKIIGKNRHTITPHTNQLIIFPGWINHWVNTNNSDIVRRCVVFDLIFR